MTRLNYKYSVTAIFISTKRKRTVIEIGPNPEFCRKKLEAIGYKEPFEISKPLFEPPSEAQLNYAKKLEIEIPDHASTSDVSALISRKEDDDFLPTPAMLDYAYEEGLYFSEYIGNKALYNIIFHNLPLDRKISFFAYRVYVFHTNDGNDNPNHHSKNSYFKEYASRQIGNESFVRSLSKHTGSELITFGEFREIDGVSVLGASKNTVAYQSTLKFLKERGLLRIAPVFEKKTLSSPNPLKTSNRATQNALDRQTHRKSNKSDQDQLGGCVVFVSVILTILLLLIVF